MPLESLQLRTAAYGHHSACRVAPWNSPGDGCSKILPQVQSCLSACFLLTEGAAQLVGAVDGSRGCPADEGLPRARQVRRERGGSTTPSVLVLHVRRCRVVKAGLLGLPSAGLRGCGVHALRLRPCCRLFAALVRAVRPARLMLLRKEVLVTLRYLFLLLLLLTARLLIYLHCFVRARAAHLRAHMRALPPYLRLQRANASTAPRGKRSLRRAGFSRTLGFGVLPAWRVGAWRALPQASRLAPDALCHPTEEPVGSQGPGQLRRRRARAVLLAFFPTEKRKG